MFVDYNIIYIGPESLEPLSEWAWCCFAGIVFGVHNHYILQIVGLVTYLLVSPRATLIIPSPLICR